MALNTSGSHLFVYTIDGAEWRFGRPTLWRCAFGFGDPHRFANLVGRDSELLVAQARVFSGVADAYDHAVVYLSAHSDEIAYAWGHLHDHPAGILFAFCGPSGLWMRPDGARCGCLTMVRSGYSPAWTDSLTARIRSDESLTRRPSDWIRPRHLHAFARWQRTLDRELGRTPPTWRG